MDECKSLSHTAWGCTYNVVFIPKCRRKTLYGQLRTVSWRGVSSVGGAEGEPDRGKAFDAGSSTHDDANTAQSMLSRRVF